MSDRDLVSNFLAARSEEAFTEIVRRHTDMVYGVCLRVLGDAGRAEDATQATFMVLFRKIESVRTDTISGWLVRVAVQVARNMRRAEIRHERRESEARMIAQRNTSEAPWEKMRPELDSALAGLPVLQRDALVLRYYKGLSHAEISQELNCPERTVDTRLTRGLAALRQRLNARGVSVSTMVLAGGLADQVIVTAPASLSHTVAAACFGKGVISSTAAAAAEQATRSMFGVKARAHAAVSSNLPSASAGFVAATVVAAAALGWIYLKPVAPPPPPAVAATPPPSVVTATPPPPVTTAKAPIMIGESSVLPLDDSENGNLLLVQNVVLPQTATIQSMSFYVTTPVGKLRLGIYDASGPGGGPGALRAATAEFTTVTGWNTRPVTTPVSLPPGSYWLSYLPESNELHFRKDTGFSPLSQLTSFTYGPMPATFVNSDVRNSTSHWNLYATLQP